METVSLRGNARIAYIATVDLLGPFQEFPAAFRDKDRTADLANCIRIPNWHVTHCDSLSELSGGQSVRFTRQQVDELILEFGLEHKLLTAVSERVSNRLRDAGLPQNVEISLPRVSVFLCDGGFFSVLVELTIEEGWGEQYDAFSKVFGPAGRRRSVVGNVIRDALIEPLHSDSPGVIPCLHRKLFDEIRDLFSNPLRPVPLDFNYFHVAYAGQSAAAKQPGRAELDPTIRQWLYALGPDPIRSQSPDLEEFVFLGYAFSLIAAQSFRTSDWDGVLTLTRIVQYQFYRLSQVCEELQERLKRDELPSGEELTILEQRLRHSYRRIKSPTFTFNHRLLLLRDGLMTAWRAETVLERAADLIDSVRSVEALQRARWERSINIVVTVIAVVSVVSAIESLVNLIMLLK